MLSTVEGSAIDGKNISLQSSCRMCMEVRSCGSGGGGRGGGGCHHPMEEDMVHSFAKLIYAAMNTYTLHLEDSSFVTRQVAM